MYKNKSFHKKISVGTPYCKMLAEIGNFKNVILTPRENNKSPPDWKFADRFM